MKARRLYLSLFAWMFSLSACTVTIPNTRVCATAGGMLAGAECAETLTDKTEQLSFEQWVEFLEPQPERMDPKDPTRTLPARGAALCQSSEDYMKMKIAFEQACEKLRGKCTKEIVAQIQQMSARIDGLQARVTLKRRKP